MWISPLTTQFSQFIPTTLMLTLSMFVKEAEEDVASLVAEGKVSAKASDSQGGTRCKNRDNAANKAAIEVDDESLSDDSREQIDLSGLSSDD